MIDETLAMLAVRNRALALVVATTGTTTLSATSAGYARTLTGDPDEPTFVTDGFKVGQDVTPTGFPQTTVGVITKVEPDLLTIAGGRTVATEAAARSLVSGLPTMHAFENVGNNNAPIFTPIAGRPYVTEEWVPGAAGLRTWPAAGGRLQEEWLSIWTWYGLAGVGISAIRKGVDALKARFAGGSVIALGDGTHLRVRTDTTVKSGQLVRADGGFAACQITIPLRAWSRNTIAV